jgi:hypothetical protein
MVHLLEQKDQSVYELDTGWKTKESGFDFQQEEEISIFFITVVGPTSGHRPILFRS